MTKVIEIKNLEFKDNRLSVVHLDNFDAFYPHPESGAHDSCDGCYFDLPEEYKEVCDSISRNCGRHGGIIWKPFPHKGTIYISGPMTGYPDLNFPAFFEAQAKLEKEGWRVINPATLNDPKPEEMSEHDYWVQCMKKDIAELMKADSMYMLIGHEKSKGAKIELDIASHLGFDLYWQEVAK